jgi:hypothetical protein
LLRKFSKKKKSKLTDKGQTKYPIPLKTACSRKNPQKIVSKRKNKKKRKQINGKGSEEPKGNGISPEG